jgi:hypothetical protein
LLQVDVDHEMFLIGSVVFLSDFRDVDRQASLALALSSSEMLTAAFRERTSTCSFGFSSDSFDVISSSRSIG